MTAGMSGSKTTPKLPIGVNAQAKPNGTAKPGIQGQVGGRNSAKPAVTSPTAGADPVRGQIGAFTNKQTREALYAAYSVLKAAQQVNPKQSGEALKQFQKQLLNNKNLTPAQAQKVARGLEVAIEAQIGSAGISWSGGNRNLTAAGYKKQVLAQYNALTGQKKNTNVPGVGDVYDYKPKVTPEQQRMADLVAAGFASGPGVAALGTKLVGGALDRLMPGKSATSSTGQTAEATPAQAAPQKNASSQSAIVKASLETKYGKAIIATLSKEFKGNTIQLSGVIKYFGDPLKLRSTLKLAGSPAGLSKLVNVAKTQKISPAELQAAVSSIGTALPKMLQRSEAEIKAGLKLSQVKRKDMGHALDRHGPDITDSQLKARITTGIAPDGVPSATHTSTRFNSYIDMLKIREYALREAARR